ncbi:hypothetical protein DKX38_028993 [Salix brachista]|uniref:Tyrosine-protein kinase catalytic domain-containing protein n=1 Tax=Salix brachista TaxID=2182728 RepID=A0A5N5J2V1_9ROSI|nr:hypothetical protein DKX38_028993 [Salix brachista]
MTLMQQTNWEKAVLAGVLSDGTQIAVKQLSAKSKQGNREFVNEIGMISALQHPNLVRLDKGNRGNEARLAYKAEDMGYMAPEYALYGYLTYKADVYSFGVVALEIVSGMNNAKFRRGENFVCLLDWVLYLQKNGDIMEMVDPSLGSAFNKKEVVRMINVALLCTNQSPALRPTMSTVVRMLEGKTDVEELVMDPSRLSDQAGYELVNPLCNNFAQASFSGSSSENKSLVKSSEGPWTASSSSSAQDLYSVHIKVDIPEAKVTVSTSPETVIVPQHSSISNDPSPENIIEVSSPISPHISDDMDTIVGYELSFRRNRGKPPSRYSLELEDQRSRYPITNYVSTKKLSEPLKSFVKEISSHHIPMKVDEALDDSRWLSVASAGGWSVAVAGNLSAASAWLFSRCR